MITQALATATARQLADELRARRVSSRELLDTYLERINQLDASVNAVVTLDSERAYAAAALADEAAARGDWLGPLHGLPITIKDAIEVAGIRSTGGASELADYVPNVDAPSVARLKSAGAIVFGKTNVPRWSGDVQTFNSLFGTTNNPWLLDRTPGGSSGGPAAAVACGFTAFELGTDIGGSIRVPAHCCGIFGLKPSYGVISQRGYLDHLGGGRTDADVNVFGPLARGAEDLELLLSVLAGPDSERALAWRLELPEPRRETARDFRIGIWLDDAACPVDRDELAVMRQAVDRLADAGARVEDAHPAVSFSEQVALFNQLVGAAISPSLPEDVAERAGGSHRAWLRADDRRAQLRTIWQEWFERYDALICPAMATPAFPHNQAGAFNSRTVEINGTTRPYILALVRHYGMPFTRNVGRLLLTVANVATIVGPFNADWNDSHIFNDGWPSHARFHGVVGLGMAVVLSGFGIVRLWGTPSGSAAGADIAAAVPLAYWGSFFPAALVKGSGLDDEPHPVGRILGIPANMFFAALTSATAITGWALDRQSR